ncbi:MAG: hypothetical protein WCA16_00265 [Candidatus Sulfotelmatobacter sp.]
MVLSIEVDGILKLRNPEARVIPVPNRSMPAMLTGTTRTSHHFDGRLVFESKGVNNALQAQ